MNTLVALPDAPVERRPPRPPAPPVPRMPSPTQLIAGMQPQSRVVIGGIIRSAATVSVGSSFACRLTLADASGELAVLFLGRPSVPGLQPGTCISVEGRVGIWHGKLAMWNPRYRIEPVL